MYFDSHAHYDDKRFDEDREQLLNSFKENGIDYVVNSGATMESSVSGIKMADVYDFMYASVGVHPHDVKTMTDKNILELEEYCKHEKVVAIGEIGLDFFYDLSERDTQLFWFKEQLELAKKVNLPVIIHSREACQLTLNTIKEKNVTNGVIHCFSGSKEIAKEYIDLGFYIGIGGIITFKNAKTLIKVAEFVPIEKILIETDCPYLSPEPFRGQRNDSTNLVEVVKKIAEIKGLEPDFVANITKDNGKKLFNISK